MSMHFTKMHGLGNDYIYVNGCEEKIDDPASLALAMSDRHFGIGADGLIIILPSTKADFRMRMFNADGSEAEMCGNGIRCLAKYVYDHHLTRATTISVETLAGVLTLDLFPQHHTVQKVRVRMGEPRLQRQQIPMRGDAGRVINQPRFEHHAVFPEGVNTEFVRVLDHTTFEMRVWERGSGETLACGTGASAVAVACHLLDKTDRRVTGRLLGGELELEWREDDNQVYMTGPAVEVFNGQWREQE
jgi:diaminopimelate epimerase